MGTLTGLHRYNPIHNQLECIVCFETILSILASTLSAVFAPVPLQWDRTRALEVEEYELPGQ